MKEAMYAILCLLGVFTWYFSFCEIKNLSWLERHTVRQVHIASATWACHAIFELTRFTAQIWSSQYYFTLKSVDLIEAWKAGLGDKIIRLWQWFTRYFLFDKEPWQTRVYICRVSEAVRKCSLLFLLFIMLLVILFFYKKKKKRTNELE